MMNSCVFTSVSYFDKFYPFHSISANYLTIQVKSIRKALMSY